jgi:cytochrome c oxidase subunit 4
MSNTIFLNGKETSDAVETHHHVSPTSHYVAVLGALFVLTGLTYAVSFADLGPASLPVAIFVAVIKASLVVAFFMHLKYDDKYNLFVFLGTLIFIGIFFGFVLFDFQARDALNDEQRTFVRKEEERNAGNVLQVGISNDPTRLAEFEAAHGGHGEDHGGEGEAHGEGEAAEGGAAEH